ncbi:MAG: transcriptional regulator [Blastopirellula sp.]|nr:MAG: transcriptional regulator [Blastopirellula sp.]
MTNFLSLSTDQVAAFVELARQGSIRGASQVLHITEQGVRNRLLALERVLHVELYRKSRGVRRTSPLTAEGQQFLPQAIAFLERANELGQMFTDTDQQQTVNVIASQYLIAYLLIGVVQKFHKAEPNIRIHLSSHTEHEIEETLLSRPEITLGVAAPYEGSPDLEYEHLFSMDWSLITPQRHPLLRLKRVRIQDLASQPLILYERGSTGRVHVMDAFGEANVSPQVEMEATNTDIIIRMVAAGIGISIVPLLSSGAVTRGHKVGIRTLEKQIRPIRSGILVRSGLQQSDATKTFIQFIRAQVNNSA